MIGKFDRGKSARRPDKFGPIGPNLRENIEKKGKQVGFRSYLAWSDLGK